MFEHTKRIIEKVENDLINKLRSYGNSKPT